MATMIAATLREDTYLLVEIPALTVHPYIRFRLDNSLSVLFGSRSKTGGFLSIAQIPKGKQYTIVGKGNLITEEQWKGIVPEMAVGARWPNYCGDYPIWFYSAKESGKSWIRSLGHVPETTLIFKRIK